MGYFSSFVLQRYRWWILAVSLNCFAITLQAAEPVPRTFVPSQDESPVLTVNTQNGRHLISRAEIESLPLYSITLQHFEGPQGSFTGVWLKDFLSSHDVNETATLRFIAHDDYSVFINSEDRRQRDYLLVTRLDGEALTLADFGPTMLIVPAEAEAVEAGTASMTHWVWSIRDIFVQ
ncbi:hypothetical protein QC823_04260 [Halomonas vilamensis]|uniref:Oxidoreductase molybdopterin-binding domain-containing protein n=1 Tax=Vreelandella vilamensis TaxID=531309 RepID=A0ABU1H2Y0_9GAMM|nr:hypothetical protein [Halomonas vilamensis]MDR5898206.1 hypothetical protein [Halomonas vilamensis]